MAKHMKQKHKKQVWLNGRMWIDDPALRSCSLGARGLWFEALCWMWGSGKDFLEGQVDGIDRLLGATTGKGCIPYLQELKKNGVATIVFSDGDQNVRIEGGRWYHSSRSRYIPVAVKQEVLSVGLCRYCGSREKLTVDHIVAFANGGTHDPKNLQCTCQKCNSKKRTKSHLEFLREVSAYGK